MTNWKDVAIASASTLVVTVISGVVIWYVTRESPQKPPTERLVYEVQKGAEFQSSTTKLGLQTVRIANAREAPAGAVREFCACEGTIYGHEVSSQRLA